MLLGALKLAYQRLRCNEPGSFQHMAVSHAVKCGQNADLVVTASSDMAAIRRVVVSFGVMSVALCTMITLMPLRWTPGQATVSQHTSTTPTFNLLPIPKSSLQQGPSILIPEKTPGVQPKPSPPPLAPCNPYLGTIILLAPARHATAVFNEENHTRFCLLRQAVDSIARHFIRRHR